MLLVFIRESYFTVTKNIRLNVTYYFIIKIANMRKSQQKILNHSSYFKFKYFIKLYKNYTREPFSFLVNDTTLLSNEI